MSKPTMRDIIAERLVRHYFEGGPWDGYMEVDIVLDALMEPTEEMVESVTDRHYMGDWECPTCGGGKAAFVAMIRAAKEGKG